MSQKRIILVGPAAAGKDYIRSQFRKKGYCCDVSYTTRPKRDGEVDGIDYHFLSETDFIDKIAGYNTSATFLEYAKHGEYWYGTGQWEWDNCEIFIMETEGVKQIGDRENCLVIYVNTPVTIRYERMKARGWSEKKIAERLQIDNDKFRNFKDYDFQITSA